MSDAQTELLVACAERGDSIGMSHTLHAMKPFTAGDTGSDHGHHGHCASARYFT
jgi:hypothetical protein